MIERHVRSNVEVTDRLVEQNKKRGQPKYSVIKRHSRIIDLLLRMKARAPILDVGCREGYLLQRLANHYDREQLFGVDVSEFAIHELRNRCFVGWVMDICNSRGLPMPRGKYHTIIASHVLEHCPYPHAVLQNLRDVAEPGTFLYVEVPKERVPKVERHGHFCAYPNMPTLVDVVEHGGLWNVAHQMVIEGRFLAVLALARTPELRSSSKKLEVF